MFTSLPKDSTCVCWFGGLMNGSGLLQSQKILNPEMVEVKASICKELGKDLIKK